MTVGEYNRMAKESEKFVVLVKKHKTPMVPPELFTLQEVRLIFTAPDSGSDKLVFLSSSGESMVFSQINKSIKSM